MLLIRAFHCPSRSGSNRELRCQPIRRDRILLAILFALSLTDIGNLCAQSSEWTWVSGTPANSVAQASIYGIQGLAAEENTPGARYSATGAVDGNGNLWLFGGGSSDCMGDLWKFNLLNQQWTWMGGTASIGSYGKLGVPSSSNHPGARYDAVSWTDHAGNFWIFGGFGYDATTPWNVLNDLWKFDTTTLQWTWVSGSSSGNPTVPGSYGSLGIPSTTNHPGSRTGAIGWTDSAGNLWLFGGGGSDASGEWQGLLNDLWRFNTSTLEWTWMGGSSLAPGQGAMPGAYGTRGVPDPTNVPGGRRGATGWSDPHGKIWVFGGTGEVDGSSGYLNDLWEFDPSTLQWVWIGGSDKFDQRGSYGTLGVASIQNTPGARTSALGWTDQTGGIWLFGGNGYGSSIIGGSLNDLWEFDTGLNNWVWRGGSSAAPALGDYGTRGVPNSTNNPPGRNSSLAWLDAANHVWIFGGATDNATLNDLWVFGAEQTALPTLDPSPANYQGVQSIKIADSSPGAIIYYTTDATKPTPNSGLYTNPIPLISSNKIAAIAVSPGHLRSDLVFGKYGIDLSGLPPAPDPVINPGSQVLKASQVVTITDSNPGAIIYYSIGSNLTSNSPVYKGPITISSSTKLNAVAYVPGYSFSKVVSATYTLATTTTTMHIGYDDPYWIQCIVSAPAIDDVSGLTGTVIVKDVTTNQILGTATLDSSTAQIAFRSVPKLPVNANRTFAFGVGDLDRDGVLDVVATDPGGAAISTLLGNGNGTFRAEIVESTNSVPSDPDSLVVADVNGDGKLDLAVAGWGQIDSNTVGGSLSILLGNGDGSFRSATLIAQDSFAEANGGWAMQRIVATDLNKDGRLDLAVSNFGGNVVSVFMGRGDGSFQAPVAYSLGNAPGPLAVGDFNNDGKPDLIVWNRQDSTVSLLLGNGDGTFKPQLVISNIASVTGAAGSSLKSIETADLNRDGNLDLIVDGILLGNGDGTFQAVPKSSKQMIWSVVGDFNDDSLLDIAYTYAPDADYAFAEISIGKGDGTFDARWDGSFSGRASELVLADLNGDGKGDLTAATEDHFVRPTKYALSELLRSDIRSAGATFGRVTVDVRGLTSHTLQCSYSGDGTYAPSVSDPITKSYGPAPPPTFSLLVGIYPASQQVTITAPGKLIHYTSDGSDPTTDSTLYTGPITVTSSVKLKAIATAVGYLQSSISEAVYTIAAIPTISVSADTRMQSGQPHALAENPPRPEAATRTVSISDSTPGAVIYYTTDGSVPSRSSTVYTTPITITKTTTVKAFAIAAGFINSQMASASIDIASPTYSLVATGVSVARGGTATSTITVSSANGFAGVVSLTCALTKSPAGAVHLPTCTANQPVELGPGAQKGTTTVTIHTTAATVSKLATPMLYWGQAATLAVVILLGIPARRRAWRRMFFVLVVLSVLGALANCGGGGHQTTPSPTKDPGTTPGRYTITVTGTGSDSARTITTTTFALTVD